MSYQVTRAVLPSTASAATEGRAAPAPQVAAGGVLPPTLCPMYWNAIAPSVQGAVVVAATAACPPPSGMTQGCSGASPTKNVHEDDSTYPLPSTACAQEPPPDWDGKAPMGLAPLELANVSSLLETAPTCCTVVMSPVGVEQVATS